MRNAKVRKRIAAGKLSLRIRDLRNLGPTSEQQLTRVGVRSAADLRRLGAVAAYLRLTRAGGPKSLNMLWALAGALDPWPEGRDWRAVANGPERLALLLAVEGREQARKEIVAAARTRKGSSGLGRAGRGSRRAAKPARSALYQDGWAPGLPFRKG
jgi:DNA transformation protein